MYDSDSAARGWDIDHGDEADGSWKLPEQRSLPEIVAGRIIQAIREGELKPGDRIVELTLAKRLGVSRGPLREALKELGARGLVETWRNRGTFVTSVTDESAIQVITMRANLEGFAARIVASTLTDAMLADLEARTREMERVGKSGDAMAYRELDWRFHERLCILAGNEYLLGAWRSISSLVWLFLLSHPDHERAVPRVINNHELMLAALASRDPDVAERTFRGVILRSAFCRYGMDVPPAFQAIVSALDDAGSVEAPKGDGA